MEKKINNEAPSVNKTNKADFSTFVGGYYSTRTNYNHYWRLVLLLTQVKSQKSENMSGLRVNCIVSVWGEGLQWTKIKVCSTLFE